jgi:NAD+ diphosphatase
MSTINDHPSAIDRCGELRTHPESLGALWKESRILHFSDGYISCDSDSSSLRYLSANECQGLIDSKKFAVGERYFLGKDATTGQSYFGWNSKRSGNEKIEENRDGYSTLRDLGSSLSVLDFELGLHAVALSNWHNSHPHCARCGAQTTVDLGGAVRVCSKDLSQHHPRTDSAVIVLIRDKDDRILLGHQPVWPEGRFSCFAGFLEPGETFEQCVSREVYEEAGVRLSKISYLGSQPWPFPASIMIAFDAIVVDPKAARPDGEEITEVKWFTRAELKAQAADGSVLLPPPMSVAYRMISQWFAEVDSSPLVGKTVGR